jgi:hypothetical protein
VRFPRCRARNSSCVLPLGPGAWSGAAARPPQALPEAATVSETARLAALASARVGGRVVLTGILPGMWQDPSGRVNLLRGAFNTPPCPSNAPPAASSGHGDGQHGSPPGLGRRHRRRCHVSDPNRHRLRCVALSVFVSMVFTAASFGVPWAASSTGASAVGGASARKLFASALLCFALLHRIHWQSETHT